MISDERLFKNFECWGNTGLSKAENLRDIIARNKLKAPLFVGDTQGDAAAAQLCGIPFAHVQYGFRNADQSALQLASFEHLCDELISPPVQHGFGTSPLEAKLEKTVEQQFNDHDAALEVASEFRRAGEDLDG